MRRKMKRSKEVEFDLEVTKAPTIDLNVLEVRGRGDKWNVFYPQAENISTPVAVYDQGGKLKEAVNSWVATNDFTQAHGDYTSVEEATKAAEFIQPGCEVKVITLSGRGANLKKRKGEDGEADSDT
jgi:hypothetical protein